LVQNINSLFALVPDMEELRGSKSQEPLRMDFNDARSEYARSIHEVLQVTSTVSLNDTGIVTQDFPK
jgi:hypothetical protein